MKNIGIVVLHFGNIADTIDCIDSLAQSTIPLRIVIVNNDPSQKNDVQKEWSNSDVHLIHSSKNLGFSQGNNVGIDWLVNNTDCDIFCIINNDAYVNSDTLEELYDNIILNDNIGITVPKILTDKNDRILWYGGGDMSWWRGGPVIPGYLGPADAPEVSKKRDVTFASGCVMMMKKSVYMKLGGFDPRYFMYVEDVDFSVKVINNNWRIVYVPQAEVLHTVQGRRKSEPFTPLLHPKNQRINFYAYHIFRNRALMVYENGSKIQKIQFAILLPAVIFKLTLLCLFNFRFKAISQIFKGLTDFWKIKNIPSSKWPEYREKEGL
ncbi:MAG: glycosyltransferase family 2 protein [Candidatus Marinimicrobia bacterium]|nr:glycosyltransferase family 2 protein [Candidatus Neomarinimicrobiota bacterium]MBT4731615.1 glycosyltransferase family 2 protein [Candidatus Woesearchaeota archaeon]MBT3760751.1 glycosyltransferase family 2 protein [Candidatus Neomarinimicrobiota bacterium]MBT3896005.1 glycosyltransferase family 2 protein [Candidatus Neomarinimicrobiota bacterium]MBT4852956.1 glycosyltransferase family 2 protein [Candidatus Neomarinimicrobiota bacterium]